MSYAINQLVRITAEFHSGPSRTGPLINPTRVEVKTIAPDGTETDLAWPDDIAVVKDATGQFHADVLADQHGTWTVRINGKGAAVAAQEWHFVVDPSKFATP